MSSADEDMEGGLDDVEDWGQDVSIIELQSTVFESNGSGSIEMRKEHGKGKGSTRTDTDATAGATANAEHNARGPPPNEIH